MTDPDPAETELVARLLEIIATEGLLRSELLEPTATIEEMGLTLDDLTLIGNAIEREFDCDTPSDEDMQACTTVRELVTLIAKKLKAPGSDA